MMFLFRTNPKANWLTKRLGDDVEEEPKVRVPEIRGIPPIALLAFIEHAHSFEVLKRHPRMPLDKAPQKISLLYELTPSGRYVH